MPEQMHPSFVNVIRQKERVKEKLSGIKHKIGVYSAKGGVGKTTTAVNIAYTLMKKGFKVGLLDADIDCPNLTMFLGVTEKMDTSKLPLEPLVKDGVKVASTAMLVDEVKKPIIWRGPIITKMLGDFFENTNWGELDYLIIDLSPGTSDGPLTIMQLLQLDGFIIVTTPQKIAATNSIRSGLMAKRLGISVLGVVENMSGGMISKNTEEIASALQTEVLGAVKMDSSFNTFSDMGKVPVLENEDIYLQYSRLVDAIV
ncbi:MAG: P-loop NTPase [Candidatus Micrarchaeota archaeon]|nr:P-loop NTPase [Candidatus Micrarchaeota archaeon]